MIDRRVLEFVSENLPDLDDLTRRYKEYQLEVTNRYLGEVKSKIQRGTPPGSSFGGQLTISGGEESCGWTRRVEISGNQTTIETLFGVFVSPTDMMVRWPLGNQDCWTGIRVSMSAALVKEAARALGVESELADGKWVLWRFWGPLSSTTVEGLHMRLAADERGAQQDDVVQELTLWNADFDRIVGRLNGV